MFTSTDVFLTLGRRGSGKSYLARRISEAYPRRVTFDLLDEHVDGDAVYTFDEFCEKIKGLENASSFNVVFKFSPESIDLSNEFDHALRILWHRGNVCITVEEIQEFCGTHSMSHWLRQQLLTGRHRNNALIFTTQRPGECHKTIVSQASHVFAGSLHEKNDIDYVRSVLGERAYELQNLPPRDFLWFRPGQNIQKIDNNFNNKD